MAVVCAHSSRASVMPGRSRPRGEMNTTPSGLTARWVIGPRPGSPPHVRLPPRPRPRLQPHTLVAWVNPVPELSYRLVQQIQAGQLYIEPGSPWENGYVESFNGKLQDELLARGVFDTLLEAKVLIERWRKAYNTVRAHSSLRYRPPAPESHRPCPLASATPQQADRGDPLAGLPW